LSFEIQELRDVIRVIVVINLSKGTRLQKSLLKRKIGVCANYVCVEMDDLDRTLGEMALEGLMANDEDGEPY
jgi:hypothetical protein